MENSRINMDKGLLVDTITSTHTPTLYRVDSRYDFMETVEGIGSIKIRFTINDFALGNGSSLVKLIGSATDNSTWNVDGWFISINKSTKELMFWTGKWSSTLGFFFFRSTANTTIDIGTYDLVVVKAGLTVRMYLNGLDLGAVYSSNGFSGNITTNPITLGGNQMLESYPHKSSVIHHEVAFFNTEIDKIAEVTNTSYIEAMYRNGNWIPTELHVNVVEHLTCQESSGDKLYSCVEDYNYAKGTPLENNHADLVGYTSPELGLGGGARVDLITKQPVGKKFTGINIVVNGDFSSGIGDWTQGISGGWTASNGAALSSNPSTALYKSVPIKDNTTYKVTYTVTTLTGRDIYVAIGNGAGAVNTTTKSTSGTHTEIVTTGASPGDYVLIYSFAGSGELILDNVVVEEEIPEITGALSIAGTDGSGQYHDTVIPNPTNGEVTLYSSFYVDFSTAFVGRSNEGVILTLNNNVADPYAYTDAQLSLKMLGNIGSPELARLELNGTQLSIQNFFVDGINRVALTLKNGKGDTSSNSLIQLWNNGVLKVTISNLSNINTSNISRFRVGHSYWYSFFFTGRLIASGYTNTVLSNRDIIKLLNTEITNYGVSPTMWQCFYNYNSLTVDTDTKVLDLSGNNRHAIFMGTAYTADQLNPAHADYAIKALNTLR